jgi:hypothetical protein
MAHKSGPDAKKRFSAQCRYVVLPEYYTENVLPFPVSKKTLHVSSCWLKHASSMVDFSRVVEYAPHGT